MGNENLNDLLSRLEKENAEYKVSIYGNTTVVHIFDGSFGEVKEFVGDNQVSYSVFERNCN